MKRLTNGHQNGIMGQEASDMKFISIRELRNSTAQLDEMIARDGSAVITNSGKPAYLMLGIDEESFEDMILDLSRIRASRATRAIQRRAKREGLDKLSLDEINAEIALSRAERKARA
jgi:antitoxin (DNA-binding transcriptional repressor) of toxin-antitoxin stability system